MKEIKKGFIPVMLTPFHENGSVDYDRLTRLTEFYLQAGVSGLFANCLSSEMYDLDEKERMAVLQSVIKTVNGAVPVVATGVFGGTIPEQAASVRRVHDAGAEAAIIITCLIAAEDERDELFDERVSRLLELTGNVPLGFYECPDPYKRVLSAEQLGHFVKTGRVIYHKDTCLDIGQIRAKLKATEGIDFGLYDAYMVHAVESLKAGSAGLSCIQGNYFPELIVWLCEHYNHDPLQDEVEKVRQFLTSNMDVMHTVYPVVAKYFLQRRGVLKNSVTRRESGVFNANVKTAIDHLFDSYGKLSAELDFTLA